MQCVLSIIQFSEADLLSVYVQYVENGHSLCRVHGWFYYLLREKKNPVKNFAKIINGRAHFRIHSMIFVTWTLLKFSLYDFDDYDDELAHLQIATHD